MLNDILDELRLALLDEEEPIEEVESIADAIEFGGLTARGGVRW